MLHARPALVGAVHLIGSKCMPALRSCLSVGSCPHVSPVTLWLKEGMARPARSGLHHGLAGHRHGTKTYYSKNKTIRVNWGQRGDIKKETCILMFGRLLGLILLSTGPCGH